jgi:hypothetical protein
MPSAEAPPAIAIRWARLHWFYLLLPLWLATSWNFHLTFDWSARPASGEAVALFDWCLFMPGLHALCYRRLPFRALAIRTVALACSGLWVAGLVVPDSAEAVLRDLYPLRMAGLALLLVVEVAASIAILRVVFGAEPDAEALVRHGIPPLLVRLMLAEARFWRRVWDRLRGR